MRPRVATFAVLCVVVAGVACTRRQQPTPSPVAGPTTGPSLSASPGSPASPASPAPSSSPAGTFDRPDLGVKLDWPAGWAKRASDDFVLLLARDGTEGSSTLSLDVPNLPPHIPGMIPVGSVRGGYLDDLRKAVGAIKTTDLPPPPLPASAEKMVRSTWTDAKGEWQETALLIVHADRVYILRGRSKTADEQATRAAFDAAVKSLQWTKKSSNTKGT
jgi:hypothetical protein